MNDHDFHRLLAVFNLSRSGYRRVRKGVKKRLVRHMQAMGCRHVDDYLERLRGSPELALTCRELLTVSVSRFFRDPELWGYLGRDVMPRLAAAGRPVQAWSAGCAGGEEVYSLRLAWEQAGSAAVPFNLTATDLNPANLERARTGVFPRGALKQVPPRLLETYFEKVPRKRQYAVVPELKAGIQWQVHDLLSPPPPLPTVDLLLVRNNLLTYEREPRKTAALEALVATLSERGLLVIGRNETLPATVAQRLVTAPIGCAYNVS